MLCYLFRKSPTFLRRNKPSVEPRYFPAVWVYDIWTPLVYALYTCARFTALLTFHNYTEFPVQSHHPRIRGPRSPAVLCISQNRQTHIKTCCTVDVHTYLCWIVLYIALNINPCLQGLHTVQSYNHEWIHWPWSFQAVKIPSLTMGFFQPGWTLSRQIGIRNLLCQSTLEITCNCQCFTDVTLPAVSA
jgi:hypothetical protein